MRRAVVVVVATFRFLLMLFQDFYVYLSVDLLCFYTHSNLSFEISFFYALLPSPPLLALAGCLNEWMEFVVAVCKITVYVEITLEIRQLHNIIPNEIEK